MRRIMARLIADTALVGVLLFATARTFAWPGAWVLLATMLLVRSVGARGVYKINPALLLQGLGLALFILGWSLKSLALRANSFAVPVVRLQLERAHARVDSGVYGVIRHPFYAADPLILVGLSLWLGSYLAALVAVVPLTCMFVRLSLEERFLRCQLPGYDAYVLRVPYRLIPGIWQLASAQRVQIRGDVARLAVSHAHVGHCGSRLDGLGHGDPRDQPLRVVGNFSGDDAPLRPVIERRAHHSIRATDARNGMARSAAVNGNRVLAAFGIAILHYAHGARSRRVAASTETRRQRNYCARGECPRGPRSPLVRAHPLQEQPGRRPDVGYARGYPHEQARELLILNQRSAACYRPLSVRGIPG
jgi:protein-S-isoprenylcysteine O-methyltransferase Ste14